MSTEDNKALVRRFYEQVFNQKKLVAIDEFSDPITSITLPLPVCQVGSRDKNNSLVCS